ncbi:hypothetical protein JCM3774_000931 [Rhodotorula dairenensis]
MDRTDTAAGPAPVEDAGPAAPPPAESASTPNAAAVDATITASTSHALVQDANGDGEEEVEPAASRERSTSSGDETDEGERRQGIKVDELETIKSMYDNRKLFGYAEPEDIVFPFHPELLDKVILWQGDLTELQVDCIVNAANKSLLGGGGVDGAIHSAAGPALLAACRKLHGAKTGETKLTRGYRLPASYVAHTVGPVYSRSKRAECEAQLRSCYRTTLDLCVENGLRTVAFSGISTGIYGYPITSAAEVACEEVRTYLEGKNGSKIDKIIFCVFRQVDLNTYLEVIPSFFPPPLGTALADDVRGESAQEAGPPEQAKKGEVAPVPESTPKQVGEPEAPADTREQKEGGEDVSAQGAALTTASKRGGLVAAAEGTEASAE